ncbi:MAG: hypothetical protein WCH30_00990 [Chlorobiaceae bacterium]
MDEIIKTVKEFGIALVEKQQRFFQNECIDNSEHVAAIRRIADTAYAYIKRKGETPAPVNHEVKPLGIIYQRSCKATRSGGKRERLASGLSASNTVVFRRWFESKGHRGVARPEYQYGL